MPKTAKKKRKGKRGEGPMPSGGAGLIRFFEDETPGIKVGPTTVVILASILVVGVILAHVWWLLSQTGTPAA
jgi:protein transport protein SEC61 subunit beta